MPKTSSDYSIHPNPLYAVIIEWVVRKEAPMAVAIVTGSAGLIGSEAVQFLANKGYMVVGIDNDMRRVYFGAEASTDWNRRRLESNFANYRHCAIDIRDGEAVSAVFAEYG